MEKMARGERMIRIFIYLMTHHTYRYSVAEIMENLGIPKGELRSVQRDMVSLLDMPGDYVSRSQERAITYYQANVARASKFILSDFDDILLQFVFLQRISSIYPATSSLITELVDKIKGSLPAKLKDNVDYSGKSLNGRILFMGTPPEYDSDIGKKLTVVLKAIEKNRRIMVEYEDNFGRTTKKMRTPLALVIDRGELYVACVSESLPGNTYTLKLRRMKSVQLTKVGFEPKAVDLENVRNRVRSGGMFFGEQNPNCEDISIYFPSYMQNVLMEGPYNRSMKISKSDEYTVRVTMKAEVNDSLKQWVLCHGVNAEVEKPESLRRLIIDSAKAIVNLYRR